MRIHFRVKIRKFVTITKVNHVCSNGCVNFHFNEAASIYTEYQWKFFYARINTSKFIVVQ